jgi:DNA-binding transcriptional LysR family regulator
MRIHHLLALVAIADKGSFTRGARSLNISQSSLSHAMTDLEDELQVSLFVRDRQGAHLTEIGRRVLTHARQALRSLDSIRSEAGAARGVLSGQVRIGSIPSATVSFLPKVIADFGRQYQKVEVVLLEEPSQGIEPLTDWLRTGTIDLALVELPAHGLKVTPLIDDEMLAIVSRGSAFARRKRLSVADLAEEPFVMSRYSSERLIHEAYAQQDLSPVVRFEVQDLGTLVSMVREGLGVSIVPRVAFSTTPSGVALVPMFPRIRRELGFAVKGPEESMPAVAAFAERLRELSRTRALRRLQ